MHKWDSISASHKHKKHSSVMDKVSNIFASDMDSNLGQVSEFFVNFILLFGTLGITDMKCFLRKKFRTIFCFKYNIFRWNQIIKTLPVYFFLKNILKFHGKQVLKKQMCPWRPHSKSFQFCRSLVAMATEHLHHIVIEPDLCNTLQTENQVAYWDRV